MKRNKVAKLMVVAALVGAIGIGGSLALLTARSEAVTIHSQSEKDCMIQILHWMKPRLMKMEKK